MKAWKFAEQQVPQILGEGWKRLTKKFYGHSTHDVGHTGQWKHLKIDVKTRNRFSFHRMMESIRVKYCSFNAGKPILITREKGRQAQFYATMDIEFFKDLLENYQKCPVSPEKSLRDCPVTKDIKTGKGLIPDETGTK